MILIHLNFKFIFIDSRCGGQGEEREREREKHRCERNIDQWLPTPTREWTGNPGMRPDWELNLSPFSAWDNTPTRLKIFLISLETYGLFGSVLFNFQLFGDFPDIFLLLIFSLIPLCCESRCCMICIILSVLRCVLWPRMWSSSGSLPMNC